MKGKNDLQTDRLVELIVEGILKKKGRGIIVLDLSELENSICNYFVICHGESTTQTSAIGGSVEEVVREKSDEKLFHKEGFKNATWILLDYSDVVVHIFLEHYRLLYNLEELWADAKSEVIEEEE